MTKASLIEQFKNNHEEFIDYIDGLTETEFMSSTNGKWTPGQQLEHVYLCLVPIAKVLPSSSFIKEKFGVLDRTGLDYEMVITNYKAALSQGGKAPDKFLPAAVELAQKGSLIDQTNQTLSGICQSLNSYTEAELDTLVLPHPLLGKLSISELFFLMSYHAIHHLDQTKQNLLAQG